MSPLSLLLALALPSAANAGNRVVLIGDSHSVTGFGRELVERIAAGGHAVDVYASCGSSPGWFLAGQTRPSPCGTWFRRSGADTRTAQATPVISNVAGGGVGLVIIALGTNMANWRSGGVGNLGDAGTLAHHAMMHGAKCVWVGPPPVRGYPELPEYKASMTYDDLDSGLRAQVATHCTYVRSTTPYSGGDGIHYDARRAEQWAEQVYRDPGMTAALSALR
jgi:hypothetical protein